VISDSSDGRGLGGRARSPFSSRNRLFVLGVSMFVSESDIWKEADEGVDRGDGT